MSTPEERFIAWGKTTYGESFEHLVNINDIKAAYLAATEDAARIAEEILPELEPEDCCFAMIVGTAAAIREGK